jgi:hypothetical protein
MHFKMLRSAFKSRGEKGREGKGQQGVEEQQMVSEMSQVILIGSKLLHKPHKACMY